MLGNVLRVVAARVSWNAQRCDTLRAQCSPSQVVTVAAGHADDRADSWAEVLRQIDDKRRAAEGKPSRSLKQFGSEG